MHQYFDLTKIIQINSFSMEIEGWCINFDNVRISELIEQKYSQKDTVASNETEQILNGERKKYYKSSIELSS